MDRLKILSIFTCAPLCYQALRIENLNWNFDTLLNSIIKSKVQLKKYLYSRGEISGFRLIVLPQLRTKNFSTQFISWCNNLEIQSGIWKLTSCKTCESA